MEIKAKDMCPRCKYCLGMTPQGMYSCGYADDASELNICIDVVLNCANFEWEDENEDELKETKEKLKCKLLDILQKKEELEARVTELIKASKRKDELIQSYRGKLKERDDEINLLNSKFDKLGEYYRTDEKLIDNIQKVIFPQEEGCDYTYSYEEILDKVKDLKVQSDGPCDKISLLQHELEMDRLRREIHQLEKEKAAHMKGIERLKKSQEKLQNQIKNLQTTNEESYKREEKLEDKCHKLERRLLEENKRFDRLGTELLMPLTHILYHGEKVCKSYSDILTDIKLLNKGIYDLKEDNKRLADKNKSLEKLYSDIRYALYKDTPLDESISCPRDIPSEVEIIEDLKKSAAESDYYKEKSELLEENLHKAETDVTTLNSKVEVLENKLRKADSIRDAVWNEEELKQKISDLETTISSKNTYIDILLNTNKDLTESNENLTKMIERRDRWVKEFKSDVYTLQNEILRIRNIAQKAYDDTNRD